MKLSDLALTKGFLKTLTPSDINNYSHEEIIALADKLSDPCKVPIKVRYNLLVNMYNCFNYDLSNDLLLALLVYTKQKLILAPAGGCKTTTSQAESAFLKIIWKIETGQRLTSSECLCLVYNRENRPQMVNKHMEIVNSLLTYGFVSINPDDEVEGEKGSKIYINPSINASTMHAFANNWIFNYTGVLGISDFSLMSAEQESMFINSAIRKLKKAYPDKSFNVKGDKVKLVYDLIHGLLLSYDEISLENPLLYEAVSATGLSPDQLKLVLQDYDTAKRFMNLIDFTDQLSLMYKLLCTVPEVAPRLQKMFPYIIVDEIQDFTPLMMGILQQMVGDDTRLLCIGDEDQSIYSFRGADIDNALKFSERFPNSKSFQLLVNRRCGSEILKAASVIIGLNRNRYDKELIATRSGGKVDLVPYSNPMEMYEKISDRINAMSYEEKCDTVICVRDKVYGQPLTNMLFNSNVEYHTFNVSRFENHEIFRNFISIMNLLWSPGRENWKTLYKVVNISKANWYHYLGCDPNKPNGDIKNFKDVPVWWELDFAPFLHYAKLRDTLNFLYSVSRDINKVSCLSYLEKILELFTENYWISRCSEDIVPYSDAAMNWIRSIFAKQLTYPVLYREFSNKTSLLYRNEKNKSGVTVATFHSLKGLEYENVIMAFLEDSIFPGYSFIESKNYSESATQRLKEAENRLAYVAMTRAKNYLGMFYDITNPSIYVSHLGANLGVNIGTDSTISPENQIVFSNRREW